MGAAAGSPFSPREVTELCLAVEPSDSTIYPGICLFDHRKGSQLEAWGQAPPLEVVVLDPGGGVDTLNYNQRNFQGKLRGLQSQHQEAFELLKIGLHQADPQAIGRAATLSARAHQEILPNQLVELMLKHLPELPALGICRAHSGTLVGVLIDPQQIPAAQAADIVRNALPGGVRCRVHRLANGGPQYVCPPAAVQQENQTC